MLPSGSAGVFRFPVCAAHETGMTTTAPFNPNRVPKGVPARGGQFDHKHQSDPVIPPLGSIAERDAVAARADLLASGGFTPPTRLAAVAAPASTKHLDQWWDRSRLVAEYQPEGKKYEQMPDDFTPSRGIGAALSGHRRTHRMNYSGAGVELRMPSATAVRRFSAEHGNRTFDVPVVAGIGGGTPVQRMVRVTKTGPHSWVASALDGNGSEDDVMLAEAVTSVLEARRVSMALKAAGDLLARHEARRAAQGSELEPVLSSFIEEVGYDDRAGVMATVIGGKVHTNEVPRGTFELVKTAERPGSVFNKLVKNQGSAGLGKRCAKCARFVSESSAHLCPAVHKHKDGGDTKQEYLEKAKARAAALAANARTAGTGAPAPVKTAPAPAVSAPAPVKAAPAPAPAAKAEPSVPSDYKRRGPIPLDEARGVMRQLKTLKPGDPVLLDGKIVYVQEYAGETYGHPDNKHILKVGYGPGRYNREISVAAIKDGFADVQALPET